MAKSSTRAARRWVTTTEAMHLLGVPSRRALDRWVASGKLQTVVREGVRWFSGPAIDRSRSSAPLRAAAASDGLSPEEMSLLGRPVRRPEPAPRAPSRKDEADDLPRMLEPYLSGLHEKIDGLSEQVSSLSNAIEERPRAEEVHAEVVTAEPDPAPVESPDAGASHASRLFETFATPRSRPRAAFEEVASHVGEGYALRTRRVPASLLVALVLVAAALAATLLLWVLFGA